MIGKILGNRYHIIERIGGGGMADVYRAHDDKLDREVAVKVLKDEFVDDADFVEKFKKESHAAARLNHNNIVGVFDVGMDEIEEHKCYYIVMEIVEGNTLKEIIKAKGHLSVPEAINYTYQISDALIKAHENGIIHRDIKPQNIIVNNYNVAKVTDFGIAKAASNVTVQSNNDILGSVHYFSPEQARGANTDERSDIYSLGIVLYEMLTGELPFDAENPISIALKQVQEQIKAPSEINSEVSPELDKIVLKMTDKKPQNRYRNVRHVINDLKHLNIDLSGIDASDTVIIPRINNPRPIIEKKVDVDDQRRIRRASIESSNRPKMEPNPTMSKDSRGKSAVSIILGILFALIVATGGFYLLFQWWVNQPPAAAAKEVQMLNILGMQEADAKQAIENLNLKFEVTDRLINHDFEPGDVISQSVEAGTMVKEGYTVRVTVNNIAEEVEVRNYLSLNYEDVLDQLESHGLELDETEYEEVEEDEVGKILSQDLKVGDMVSTGTKISFVVGQAKELKKVEMPDLIGLTETRAEALLKQYKLEIGEVTEDYSDKVDKNEVMDQSVEPGQEIEEGTKIDVVIAIGSIADRDKANQPEVDPVEEEPEEEETTTNETPTEEDYPPITIGITIPQDQETTVIKIIRDINGKQEVVYNETHFASEKSIVVPLQGMKDAKFEVYKNGVLDENN